MNAPVNQTIAACMPAFSDNKIWQMRLNNAKNFIQKYNFYDEYHKKQIPFQILNANKELQFAFLKGYNAADGLRSNPCVYEFKNFKTNSTTLAAGLIFVLKNVTVQNFKGNGVFLTHVDNFLLSHVQLVYLIYV